MLDLWTAYDLPLLTELVQRLEVDGEDSVDADELVADGRTAAQVQGALRRLDAHGFLVAVTVDLPYPVAVTGVTEKALRVTGAWPSPEQLVDRLLAALAEAAQNAASPEERSKARRALDTLGSLGREVLVNAAGGALGGAID